MAHDLLVDPLISWRDRDGRRWRATLPGVLAHLSNGTLADFPRLRGHQFHPFSMTLAQVAAAALHRDGGTQLPQSEAEWTRLLLQLTDGQHEPWTLVVNELSKPAFFQPPVPEGSLAAWKTCERPDDIDVLVTAKGHDVKSGLMHGDEPETWIYALTTLQTTQGYPGRGYHGIARMKGGYGSRPRVGISPDHTVSSRFVRDVQVMLAEWPALINRRGYATDGIALTWLIPWDGRTGLTMDALAPHFVEVCWRVRCVQQATAVKCLYTTTATRRCLPEIEGGDVGDVWIPVGRDGSGALTVSRNGFTYRVLTDVLFEHGYAAAAAQSISDRDGDPIIFSAAVLARGQGKTEGLHERVLTLAGKPRLIIGKPDARAAIGRRAKQRLERVDHMRTKVLYPALKQLAANGPVMPDRFDARVDELFFSHLFDTLDMPDDEARASFERELARLARVELENAIARVPLSASRKYRVVCDAERLFDAGLRKFGNVSTANPDRQGAPA